MSEEQDFIDGGVADIAESMGFESETEDKELDDIEGEEPEESDQDEPTDEPEPEEIGPETTAKPQPSSWAKDKAEVWEKLPGDAKEYVELREQQMLDGINQYRDGFQYAQYIDQAIAPYRGVIQANGGDEANAIINLFEHHKAITEGSLEQRQQAFIKIGVATGLIPQEGQAKPDPMVSQLQQEINSIKAKESQREAQYREQQERNTAAEVSEFAKDKPYFDDVADDIVRLLKTGDDLPTAYEKAIWINPIVRAKELDRLAIEKSGKAKAEVEKAKVAKSVNVKGTNARHVQSKPLGDWTDTMRQVIDGMK
jgi:hypothetical protein